MNEWHLQQALRRRWLTEGVVIDDEPLFLAGWEVMTNWRVNDAHKEWNRPSADFVLLDRQGRLVVLELKPAIRSPGECLLALCQVTHSAVRLAESFSIDKLAKLSAACRGGPAADVQVDPVGLLRDAHAKFFSLSAPVLQVDDVVRRAVAACDFGPRWPSIVKFFTDSPNDVLRAHLESHYRVDARHNLAIRRYLDLPNPIRRCAPEVHTLQVCADYGSDLATTHPA